MGTGWREAAPQGSMALLLSPFAQLCAAQHLTLQQSTGSGQMARPLGATAHCPYPHQGLKSGLSRLVEMASHKGAG